MIGEVKIGMIGAGYAAHVRATAIKELGGKRLKINGVYDKKPAHSSEFAKEFNTKSFSSLEEILESSDINTVSVAVPNRYHYEIVKQALESGKNVICEYPLVIDRYKKGEELVRLADKKNLLLHVGHTMNYDADFKLAESHKKDLGKLAMGYRYWSFGPPGSWFEADGFIGNYSGLGRWYIDDNKKGGWIVSSHYHGIQIFRKIFGEVTSVCAYDTSEGDVMAASVMLMHETGASSTVQWAVSVPGKAFNTTIISGSRGSLEVNGESYLVHTAEIKKQGKLSPASSFIEDLNFFTDEIDGKKDSREENRDMLKVLNVALCAEESVSRGKMVKVTY